MSQPGNRLTYGNVVFERQLTLRLAIPGDERALRQLADLDSQPHLHGRTLMAEVDGEPVAALDLDRGAVVANPFVPTADVASLLSHVSRNLSST